MNILFGNRLVVFKGEFISLKLKLGIKIQNLEVKRNTLLLVALGAIVLYMPTLKNGFVHDDEGQLVQNPYVQSMAHIPRAFTSCIWEAYLGTCRDMSNYYRPAINLSYIFTWVTSPTPRAFHAVNLVYYALLCTAVYLLAESLLRNRLAATITAGLFLIHPIHSEAVMWIASVPELLYSVFIVTAVWIHVQRPSNYVWWEVGLFGLGLFSKEPAIFLPIILVLYDILFDSFKLKFETKNLKLLLARYWRFLIPLALYLLFRIYALGSLRGGPAFFDFSPTQRLFTTVHAFGAYLLKTLWPATLNPFMAFEPVSSASDPRYVTGAIATVLFTAFLIWAIATKKRLIIFGLTWYLLFLSPVLVFIDSVGENVISERYLLLPSMGLVLIAGYYLNIFFQKAKPEVRIITGIVCAVLAFLAIRQVTSQYSVWKDSKTFYQYVHAQNVEAGYPADVTYYNLGVIYQQEGNTAQAQRIYEEIVLANRSFPSLYKAYSNLGQLYLTQGHTDDGIRMIDRALELQPAHDTGLANRGLAAMAKQQYVQAAEYMLQALLINPNHIEAQHNLEILYDRLNELPYVASDEEKGTVNESTPDLLTFVDQLLQSPVWQQWQQQPVPPRFRLVNLNKQLGGASDVTIATNPNERFRLSPNFIFTRADGKTTFVLDFLTRYDEKTGNVTLAVLPVDPPPKVLELYLITSDLKPYRFVLTSSNE